MSAALPPGWQVHPVADPNDPRLGWFRDLTDMDLRRAREPIEGIFMAEGRLVIERAVASGLTPLAVLTEPRWLAALSDCLAAWHGPIYVGDEAVLRAVTGYRVHRGALATCRRPPTVPVADLLAGEGDLVILEDLVDPTNVGLVLRSAAALGMGGALLSPSCGDPLYRRSVKVSMGAVLTLPWARCVEWPDPVAAAAQSGLRVLALTPAEDAEDIDDAVEQAIGAGERIGLALGTEGPGLSAGLLAVGRPVRIPMHAGVDSLNVAAAAAVACSSVARARRRRASPGGAL